MESLASGRSADQGEFGDVGSVLRLPTLGGGLGGASGLTSVTNSA